MKEQYREGILNTVVTIVFICVLFVVSHICAEFIYSKMFPEKNPEHRLETINVPSRIDTVYFDTCIKCKN